jgi:hypothetical protein
VAGRIVGHTHRRCYHVVTGSSRSLRHRRINVGNKLFYGCGEPLDITNKEVKEIRDALLGGYNVALVEIKRDTHTTSIVVSPHIPIRIDTEK